MSSFIGDLSSEPATAGGDIITVEAFAEHTPAAYDDLRELDEDVGAITADSQLTPSATEQDLVQALSVTGMERARHYLLTAGLPLAGLGSAVMAVHFLNQSIRA